MNNNLAQLHSYPFTKMAILLANSTPAHTHHEIRLDRDQSKHTPPSFVLDVLRENLDKISQYPTTNGSFDLRQAIAHWLERRFFLNHVNPHTEVLPVLGTQEAIFSFVQAAITTSQDTDNKTDSDVTTADNEPPIVMMPNPFYQTYEGAAILAQATPYFVSCTTPHNFKENYREVPKDIWQRTQLLVVSNPNNPTGSTMTMDDWEFLIRLSDKYDFIIASDECYSELYVDDPPIGLLQACATLGRHHFKNCVVFHSLSKRSNLSGLRSGFIAGDTTLLKSYLQYRTYQGCAMPIPHQIASIVAWQDEKHVAKNRALYREKFALWMAELGELLDLQLPDAGVYLWIKVPEQFHGDDEVFVKVLYEQAGIYALAGRYLSRDVNGENSGKGYIRVALVSSIEENRDAVKRIQKLLSS